MKNLYIVDYWVPFPQSEYGGIVNVIAETDSEVFDLLSADDSFHESYISRIMPNVKNAQKFPLVDEYDEYAYEVLEDYVTDTVGSYEIYQEYLSDRNSTWERD